MIYAIQAGLNGPIKLGRAVDPAKRLQTLQTGHPEVLRLLAVEPCGNDEEAEKTLHQHCAAFRLRGEWFMPHGRVLETVQNMGKGNAEISILLERMNRYSAEQQRLKRKRALWMLVQILQELAKRRDGR